MDKKMSFKKWYLLHVIHEYWIVFLFIFYFILFGIGSVFFLPVGDSVHGKFILGLVLGCLIVVFSMLLGVGLLIVYSVIEMHYIRMRERYEFEMRQKEK